MLGLIQALSFLLPLWSLNSIISDTNGYSFIQALTLWRAQPSDFGNSIAATSLVLFAAMASFQTCRVALKRESKERMILNVLGKSPVSITITLIIQQAVISLVSAILSVILLQIFYPLFLGRAFSSRLVLPIASFLAIFLVVINLLAIVYERLIESRDFRELKIR